MSYHSLASYPLRLWDGPGFCHQGLCTGSSWVWNFLFPPYTQHLMPPQLPLLSVLVREKLMSLRLIRYSANDLQVQVSSSKCLMELASLEVSAHYILGAQSTNLVSKPGGSYHQGQQV